MSLPGRKSRPDDGAVCYKCKQPAVCKICVEADSFGEEYEHLCQLHMEEHDENKRKHYETPKECMWCRNTEALGVRPFRDPDEGCNGPIYDVCEKCRQEHIAKITRPHLGQHEAIRRLKQKQNDEMIKEIIPKEEVELSFEDEDDD